MQLFLTWESRLKQRLNVSDIILCNINYLPFGSHPSFSVVRGGHNINICINEGIIYKMSAMTGAGIILFPGPVLNE